VDECVDHPYVGFNFQVGENKDFIPNYIKERREVIDLIRDRLNMSQSREKTSREMAIGARLMAAGADERT
jgi:hypothetical protein